MIIYHGHIYIIWSYRWIKALWQGLSGEKMAPELSLLFRSLSNYRQTPKAVNPEVLNLSQVTLNLIFHLPTFLKY